MPTITKYDDGDRVRMTATFTDIDSVNVDPSTVTFQIRDPAGTVVSYTYGTDAEVVKDAVGVYHVVYDLDTPGEWVYRFSSTGTGKAAATKHVFVDPDVFS